jgi:hypothetical protein
MRNLIACHHKHCISAFLSSFIASLRHSPKILAERCLPYFSSFWVVHELFVTGYHFSRDRMYHGACVMFKTWGSLIPGKREESLRCEDCVRANSWVVNTFRACCVNKRSCRRLGIAMVVVGSAMTVVFVRGDTRCAGEGVPVCVLFIAGRAPGVLFLVTRWCRHGVSLRARLAVGFWDCKIGGASVMRVTTRTVRIGILLITLCCCSCNSPSLTL